ARDGCVPRPTAAHGHTWADRPRAERRSTGRRHACAAPVFRDTGSSHPSWRDVPPASAHARVRADVATTPAARRAGRDGGPHLVLLRFARRSPRGPWGPDGAAA